MACTPPESRCSISPSNSQLTVCRPVCGCGGTSMQMPRCRPVVVDEAPGTDEGPAQGRQRPAHLQGVLAAELHVLGFDQLDVLGVVLLRHPAVEDL